MDLFTKLGLPHYSVLEMTVDYLSYSGKKQWTFLVQFNCHRTYTSLDEVFDCFLEVAPEDYLETLFVKFEIKYNYA